MSIENKIMTLNNEIKYLPSIGRLLGFSSKASNDLAEKKLLPFGLTLQQWVLMSALWRKDGLTVGELTAYYKAKESSTSNLIARMEKKELLLRKHDLEDRRQVRIFLTEKGKALSHKIEFYNEINNHLLSNFDETEKQQLISMLERVIINAQKAIKEN